MTNRYDFLELSFHTNKLSFRLEVTPLLPTPSPPGLKKNPGNEPNLNYLRNHLINRDDCLNLNYNANKLTSSLKVNTLPPTPSPPGLKNPKNEPNLNFLRNHLINRYDFLNLSFYAYKLTLSLEVPPPAANH